MKKIISVLCCTVILFLVLAFSGCGGPDSAEAAFKAFMNAQENGDMSEVIDLTPASYYDYLVNMRIKNGYDKETAENIAEIDLRPVIFRTDLNNILGENFSIKDEFSFEYEILDKYKASSGEVSEFNKFVKNKFSFNMGADSVVLIKAVYSVDSKSDYFDFDNLSETGICIQINGKWHYMSCNSRGTTDLFLSRKGLQMLDCVEWMFNWFNK